ncbi:hypothetical protein GH146_01340 [archaeon]|nr:hypothetical protein [archaeon]
MPYGKLVFIRLLGGQAVHQLPCGNSRYVLFVPGASLINLALLKQERIYGIVHWKLKDELFDRQILTTLTEARVLIKECAKEHNQVRPTSALSYRVPVPEVIMRLDSNLESGITNGGRSEGIRAQNFLFKNNSERALNQSKKPLSLRPLNALLEVSTDFAPYVELSI